MNKTSKIMKNSSITVLEYQIDLESIDMHSERIYSKYILFII
jgi:hypothetical protein